MLECNVHIIMKIILNNMINQKPPKGVNASQTKIEHVLCNIATLWIDTVKEKLFKGTSSDPKIQTSLFPDPQIFFAYSGRNSL